MTDRKPPLPGLILEVVPSIDLQDYQDDGEQHNTDRWATTDLDKATVITSASAEVPGLHKVVLDIDLPAQLVPSTTTGHFHLYIDKAIPWEQYLALLKALAAAGLIEPGYLGASEARGYTAARLPWVPKKIRK